MRIEAVGRPGVSSAIVRLDLNQWIWDPMLMDMVKLNGPTQTIWYGHLRDTLIKELLVKDED